ncbi:MAG: preprotein translocase subunit SecY [Candidatus Buchananbacteria bacterium RIFCSPHIGHO2_02_FULL_40_13]|uniref:Protein translocase subunit SecY n=1 Tax=Candidatus Buchananbacteria bacterium RIFCSPLOWO2_01_FULL_39_33 TaxID=1797543 RepID=A0A1G1YMN4_9BACT|nr:MAG: preprotein translocase subunit SecY [Candidatus Buchananbacteria bacterium RIFCSPHIGHO2_01_FULL_40_35]OGY50585.1 MAG: preprotein translocase subunit SecY [Candidatus Buchananbacteria bacterium RIFCSPHIGHO2_02_FULL_40_13]OGY53056.1 MAG: preprotein translocase subunit SecY [Candidatus Buchananbacteria bacterium RIFCSPLOWO2_01_FULL_39_33]
MLNKIVQIWKINDLRKSILFVLAMLVIFRIAAHIPVPNVDVGALKNLFQNNQLLGLINVFSGGSMENFSVVMLGIAPYITASIIFQLLTMVIPKLEELSKEGEYGRQKINQWTRWLTVPLAFLQSFGMITILRQSAADVLPNFTSWQMLVAMVTITGGTIFLMWIGELISEKHIGNGISLLIFAGIISGLPTSVGSTFYTYDQTQIVNMIVFTAIALITIISVVIITEGQRNIPVSYARRIRGNKVYGGTNTHLPLRVNQAGVIPIIFAIAIIMFPPLIAQLFLRVKTSWLAASAQWVVQIFQDQLFYGIAYFVMVVAFTYFYTAVIFHPDQIAENLQKQGGFVPGIRPGKTTAEYLQKIVTRIIFTGALFLGIIAVLPLITAQITSTQSLVVGGTSLLIVVSVVIEMVSQINAQLSMRDYEEI